MSAQGPPLILNPKIYLNYLDPDEASNYELNRNIVLVTLGYQRIVDMNVGKALIWDILSSIPDDYRSSVLAMVILAVLLKTGPVSNCTLVAMGLVGLQVVSSAAASFLFLKRVCALYYDNKTTRYVFSILWVIGVGTSCAVFSSTLHDYREIANTKHCVRYQGWTALSIAFMDPVLFDTLVYFAIMYKILSAHRVGQKKSWRTFCSGNDLPHLSRAVFQGGQQYYLITTGANMMRFVFSAMPSASPTVQVMVSTPAVVLTSVIACQVHRNMLIEALDEARTNSVELTTVVFANGRVSLPLEVKSDVTGQPEQPEGSRAYICHPGSYWNLTHQAYSQRPDIECITHKYLLSRGLKKRNLLASFIQYLQVGASPDMRAMDMGRWAKLPGTLGTVAAEFDTTWKQNGTPRCRWPNGAHHTGRRPFDCDRMATRAPGTTTISDGSTDTLLAFPYETTRALSVFGICIGSSVLGGSWYAGSGNEGSNVTASSIRARLQFKVWIAKDAGKYIAGPSTIAQMNPSLPHPISLPYFSIYPTLAPMSSRRRYVDSHPEKHLEVGDWGRLTTRRSRWAFWPPKRCMFVKEGNIYKDKITEKYGVPLSKVLGEENPSGLAWVTSLNVRDMDIPTSVRRYLYTTLSGEEAF
ncbi:hypothetical protein EDC04DRAFT_2611579 [Pisolithus marmoratus]|nr:hypothetical protein EDC04DRAFT_2611579 [Pisolithus marmoratus]